MILIKDASIVDGTGNPPYNGDVLIKDNRISAIGEFPRVKADITIDGMGSQITPGFIDVNTSSDHYLTLFTNPEQGDFLLQGVTTIIGGNCGSSLAPLLYGSLVSIRKWTDTDQINIDWHAMKEFFRKLKKQGIGINFGTLVGHSTIRRDLLGDQKRNLTAKEMNVFIRVLKESLDAGAFGLSAGLGFVHSQKTPFSELKKLAMVVHDAEAVFAFHLRNEEKELVSSIKEIIKLAKESKVSIEISHLQPLLGFEDEFSSAIDLLDAEAKKLNITFDSYPFDTNLIPIYTLLPASVKANNLDMMHKNLTEDIINDLPDFNDEDIIIAHAPKYEYLVGETIGEFAKNHNLKLKEALLKLMQLTKLRAVVFYKSIDIDLAIQSLLNEHALVGSNGTSFSQESHTARHERLVNTFPRFLKAATQTGIMKIEKAIQKITSQPAQKFGIRDRGIIAEGNYADLNLIKNGEITHVLVNGKLAVKDKTLQSSLSGKVLRKE